MTEDVFIPPIDGAVLDLLRFDAGRLARSGGIGAHLRRRLGQSLEFREYREYAYGDDVRHVDWRASLRHGGKDGLLVRTFEAEERLTVAVSIDPRPSMYLPKDRYSGDGAMSDPAGFQRGSKMQIACWLLLVISELAAMDRDGLLIHELFREKGAPGKPVRSGDLETVRQVAMDLVAAAPRSAADWDRRYEVEDAALLQALPPASVLIVLSDFYEVEDRLVEMLRLAQNSYREVILVALNSWPVEAARLGSLPLSEISGVEGFRVANPLTQIDESFLRAAANNLNAHMERLRAEAQAGGLCIDHWAWPDRIDDHAAHLRAGFQDRLLACEGLATVFLRVS